MRSSSLCRTSWVGLYKEVGLTSEEEVGLVSDDAVLVLVLDEEADENSLYPVKHLASFRDDYVVIKEIL